MMNAENIPIMERRPLGLKTAAEVAELMRDAGMWAPNADMRSGIDALLIREDVCVLDAFDSVDRLVRMAGGVLLIMECDGGGDRYMCDAASAVRDMVRQMAGHLAVIREGIGRDETAKGGAA